MDGPDDIYSQKAFLLIHPTTVYWQRWDLASSCWDEILSRHDLFLLHVSVEKRSVQANRRRPAKTASGLCFRGLVYVGTSYRLYQ